jgi:hypothetical protein
VAKSAGLFPDYNGPAILSETGALSAAQTIATLPSGFTARNTCSQIHLAPSGRFLYVGNRGHNSIAGFAVDPATGHLTPAGRAMTRPISAALSSNKTVNTVGSLLRRTASSQPSRPR